MKRSIFLIFIILVLSSVQVFAKPAKIAVFIPGVRAGSAIYESLVAGVEKAAAEQAGSTVKIFEAGFNQSEWEEKLTSLVATGEYDFVVTSNPSMPDLIAGIASGFPTQKFICLDGYLKGNPQLYTVLYNQLEQGYVTGYLAGLVSASSMPGANAAKKVGLIIGQHYPVMDKIIIPGFELGLKAADPAFQLDTRVIGNWYDATKAADLAKSMFAADIDVILPIAGSASQGVIKTAQDSGKYIVFFDGDEYARAPRTILGCTALNQKKLAYTKVKAAFEGKLPFGTADIVGMKEGYVEFLDKSPSYRDNVPQAIRAKVDAAVTAIKTGKLVFTMPAI